MTTSSSQNKVLIGEKSNPYLKCMALRMKFLNNYMTAFRKYVCSYIKLYNLGTMMCYFKMNDYAKSVPLNINL